VLSILLADIAKNMADKAVQPTRPARSYHTPRPAMDLNFVPTHVELKETQETAEDPVITIIEPKDESEVVKLEFSEETDESPETLELGYELGTRDYKGGEILWTHKAEYVVDKLENDILYLVRRDVWKARKKAAKKASHVELKVDEPSEHVELEAEENKPSEVVTLKFD
jgi:hypothetical protein